MPGPDDNKSEFSHISDLIEHHLALTEKKDEWSIGKNAAMDLVLEEQRKRLQLEIEKKAASLEEAKYRKHEQDMNDAAQKKIEEIVASQVKKDEYAKGTYAGATGRRILDKAASYQVPAGTTILIYTRNEPLMSNLTVRASDFEVIVSSKEVAYEPDDVLVNPVLGKFKRNCGLDGLLKWLYNTEGMYFAFELPKNDKNIPCILVLKDDVTVIWQENPVLKSALDKLMAQNVKPVKFLR